LDDLDEAVARVLSGDAAAFRRIVDATGERLFRLAARILGNVEEAEDVLQDAYLRIYRSLLEGRFDGRSSLFTWMYRIVANAAIDARRGRVRRPTQPEFEGADASDPDASEARIALGELSQWLAVLPDDQRVALILTAVEGLTAAEVGRVLGCSEGAVEQRLLRARSNLRRRRGEP
jgi:RNA polymerase sigma-70 factor, ECF subfamily